MIRFRWSGAEPKDLNDVKLAEELGATWEGDELGDLRDGLAGPADGAHADEYTIDND